MNKDAKIRLFLNAPNVNQTKASGLNSIQGITGCFQTSFLFLYSAHIQLKSIEMEGECTQTSQIRSFIHIPFSSQSNGISEDIEAFSLEKRRFGTLTEFRKIRGD